MPDSDTLWLTVTNVALGVGVGLCVLIAAVGLGYEVLVQWKRRRVWREMDRNLCELLKITPPGCSPRWR